MVRRPASEILLMLLLIGMLTLASNIQPVRASGTIYIRPDGSVDGTDKIKKHKDVYTFTDDIYESIRVQRGNIVVDGAGYTLQGGVSEVGIFVLYENKVTIKNMKIRGFQNGIVLYSSNSTISGTNITNNYIGIHIQGNDNSISGNEITHSIYHGIRLAGASSGNTFFDNYLMNNYYGIYFLTDSSNNTFYHNNFVDNTQQVRSNEATNVWDDSYPSGGNYWSDYTGVDLYSGPNQDEPDSDGIGDTSYSIPIVDWQGNTIGFDYDDYPLMNHWTPRTINELKIEIEELGSEGEIDNQGTVTSLIAKLIVAEKLVDMGRLNEAKTVLECFILQVQKLAGIRITVQATDILIKSAEHILSHL